MSAAEEVEAERLALRQKVAEAVRAVLPKPDHGERRDLTSTANDYWWIRAYQVTDAALAALAPIREAEQQAAKREAWDQGFTLGVNEGAEAGLGQAQEGQTFSTNPYRDLAATHDEGGEQDRPSSRPRVVQSDDDDSEVVDLMEQLKASVERSKMRRREHDEGGE